MCWSNDVPDMKNILVHIMPSFTLFLVYNLFNQRRYNHILTCCLTWLRYSANSQYAGRLPCCFIWNRNLRIALSNLNFRGCLDSVRRCHCACIDSTSSTWSGAPPNLCATYSQRLANRPCSRHTHTAGVHSANCCSSAKTDVFSINAFSNGDI